MRKNQEETKSYEAQYKEAKNTVANPAWAVQVSKIIASYRLLNTDTWSVRSFSFDDASPFRAHRAIALSYQASALSVR